MLPLDMFKGSRGEAAFRRDYLLGHEGAEAAARVLRAHGLKVDVAPPRLRPDVAERAAYDDGGVDLLLPGGASLQVKRKTGYRFSGLRDFPFPTIVLDSHAGYERLKTLPAAYLLLPQDCSAVVGVTAATVGSWRLLWLKDKTRGDAWREFVECPTSCALDAAELAVALRDAPVHMRRLFSPLERWVAAVAAVERLAKKDRREAVAWAESVREQHEADGRLTDEIYLCALSLLVRDRRKADPAAAHAVLTRGARTLKAAA